MLESLTVPPHRLRRTSFAVAELLNDFPDVRIPLGEPAKIELHAVCLADVGSKCPLEGTGRSVQPRIDSILLRRKIGHGECQLMNDSAGSNSRYATNI